MNLSYQDTTVYTGIQNHYWKPCQSHLSFQNSFITSMDHASLIEWMSFWIPDPCLQTSEVQSLCSCCQCDVSTQHLLADHIWKVGCEVYLQRHWPLKQSQVKYWNAWRTCITYLLQFSFTSVLQQMFLISK